MDFVVFKIPYGCSVMNCPRRLYVYRILCDCSDFVILFAFGSGFLGPPPLAWTIASGKVVYVTAVG